MLSEISQSKTNTVWYHFYVEYKKYKKLVNIIFKKAIPTTCPKRHILGSTSQRKVQSKRTGKDTLRKQQP